MDFTFHQHGGSRLYSLQGRTGAAVLFVTLSDPLTMTEVREAGVHIPPHGYSREPGQCPYVSEGQCRYVHVSLVEKQEFINAYNQSRTDACVEQHLYAWYQHYVRS